MTGEEMQYTHLYGEHRVRRCISHVARACNVDTEAHHRAVCREDDRDATALNGGDGVLELEDVRA